jgi:hypothetical protein
MKNFGDSLKAAAQLEGIVGVMYVHDDLLVNMTNLVELGFPSESTVMSQMLERDCLRPIVRDGWTKRGGALLLSAKTKTNDFVRNVSDAMAKYSLHKVEMVERGATRCFGAVERQKG